MRNIAAGNTAGITVASYSEHNVTPQERAEWDYKTTVGVAEAMAKSEQKWVPEIMIIGEGKGSNSANPLDAVGLKMLMDVTKSMGK